MKDPQTFCFAQTDGIKHILAAKIGSKTFLLSMFLQFKYVVLSAAFLVVYAGTRSHVEYDVVFREKVSLGMRLSQDLRVLSFVDGSAAEARGVA